FHPDRRDRGEDLGRCIGTERDLHQAIPVPEIEKDQSPQVPPTMDPTSQPDFLARVRESKGTTPVRPQRGLAQVGLRLLAVRHRTESGRTPASPGRRVTPLEWAPAAPVGKSGRAP